MKSLQFIKNGKVGSWVWIAMATSLFLLMMALPFIPGTVGDQAIDAWDQAGSWFVMGYGVILGSYATSKTVQRVRGVMQELNAQVSGTQVNYGRMGSIGEEDP